MNARLLPLRLGICVVVALLVSAVLLTPASAQTHVRARDSRHISISGDVVVDQGETVNGPVVSIDGSARINGVVRDDVYVGSGNVRVDGHVTGNVLVVDGDATINGRVGGDVIAVRGRVVVNSGARVTGDVVSRRSPKIASGTVHGKVRRLDLGSILRGFLLTFLLFLWLAVTVSAALLGLLFVLLFPRASDATVAASRRFWPSLGWGALVGIVGPILGFLLLVTILGIPFGLGVLSALNVLGPLGYVAASLAFGRTMVKGTSTGSRIGAFFAGFGILRAAALLPGIGLVVGFLASIYGLGALTIAAWRAGHGAPVTRDDRSVSPIEPAPTSAGGAPDAPARGDTST
jgi:hypothetical protein